jgi:Uncharacterized alpha/beta hydrolase domain (DUF2235)
MVVKQRWFVGAHANVGGGYANDALAQIPLRWLADHAETLGLAFKDSRPHETGGALYGIIPASSPFAGNLGLEQPGSFIAVRSWYGAFHLVL